MNDHAEPTPAAPTRPRDTWRICGRPIEIGCTCDDDWGPSRPVVIAALKRLEGGARS